MKKRILTNTVVNFSGKSLSFLLQLFIITLLIQHLGKETYGIVVLALALAANTNLLEAGFGLSVTKYVAEYKVKGDWNRLLSLVNTNFLVSIILSFCFSSILLVINEFFLGDIFTIPQAVLTETKVLIRLLILLSIFEFMSISIIRVAEGFQKYSLARSMELSKWFLRAIFVFIAVSTGGGLISIGVAYLCAGVIHLFSLYFFVFARDPKLILALRLCDKESFRLLFGFSIWVLLSKIFAFISYRIDTILIGIFLPPVNLTYYNIAFKIYELMRFGLSLIASTLVPVTSELSARMDKRAISLLFKKASKYTLVLMYPILLLFLFYANKVIYMWVGGGFETAILLSQLFISSLFLIAIVSSSTEMMVGLNKVKELVIYSGIGSFVNLVVSLILIREIGVYGVVVGTLIGTCVIVAGYLYRMLIRFRITFLEFAGKIISKPAAGLITLYVVFLLIPDNIFMGALITSLYIIFLLLFTLDRDDRQELFHLLRFKKRGLL